MQEIGKFTITAEDTRDFARLSGDYNPLHIDPVAARRTQFGKTLVHGVCATAQAIDLWLSQNAGGAALRHIRARYPRPVTHNQEITVLADAQAQSQLRLELHAGGVRCQTIELRFAEQDDGPRLEPAFTEGVESPTACKEPDINDCEGSAGAVDLVWDDRVAGRLLPRASIALPPRQLASLLATTRIIGMHCPGLHSVYSSLSLDFDEAGDGASHSQLHYSVTKADTRFNRVELGVCNAYVQGTLEAFFRAMPARQASMAEVTALVPPDCFAGHKALLVGASRGLGEIMAKVLAAGGAEVTLTYARGREDALLVAKDIGSLRQTPHVLQYDVMTDRETPGLPDGLTHVFYLASPIIEKGEPGQWQGSLFRSYCRFYIDGLATLLQQLVAKTNSERASHLFVPSSIYLDGEVKGFDEYIAAKSAAEAWVERFARANPNWQVCAPRLPQLYTDQTAGVRGQDANKTLEFVVELLRGLAADS